MRARAQSRRGQSAGFQTPLRGIYVIETDAAERRPGALLRTAYVRDDHPKPSDSGRQRDAAFLTNGLVAGMTRERYDVVLSRSSLEEMWKPGMPMSQGYEPKPSEWMGLSFFVLDRNRQRILDQIGSQAGFRSFYYFDPQTQLGIVAVFNTTNYTAPATTIQRQMNGPRSHSSSTEHGHCTIKIIHGESASASSVSQQLTVAARSFAPLLPQDTSVQ